MTDLKLNLKAGNLKRILAMFMAVCLTVLSVNIPVNAAEREAVQYDEAFHVNFISALDGASAVSQYDGDVKVVVESVSVDGLEKDVVDVFVKADGITAKADKGEVTLDTELELKANESNKNKEIKFDLAFYVNEAKQFAEGYIITQLAKPVDEKAAKEEVENKLDNLVASALDAPDETVVYEPSDVLDENYYSNDADNIATRPNGKKIEVYKKTANLVTVTVLDGKGKFDKKTGQWYNPITKTNDGVVAVYQKAANTVSANLVMTTKMKANASNYYDRDGVEQKFMGYVKAKDALNSKNKPLGKTVGDATYVFADEEEILKDITEDCYIIANWVDADVLYNNAHIDVATKKSSSAQVIPEKGMDSVKKFQYEVTVVNNADPSKELTNEDNGYKLQKDQKKVISSVKYNAKTDVFTVKAGKETGKATVRIFENKKPDNTVATVTVEVYDGKGKVTSAYDALTIQTTTGRKSVNLDKNTSAKTAQLIAVPGNTSVKFVATTTPLSGVKIGESIPYTKAADANKDVKKLTSMKSKYVSVSNTGKVTAKKATDDTQYVYAYQLVKYSKTDVRLIISNPVEVKVTATARGLSLKKDTVKKYNDKDGGSEKVRYKAKKDEQIKFTVKTKGENTDAIAAFAINSDGKVVLGKRNGLQKVTKTKNNVTTPVLGQYYVGIAKDAIRTDADNLIIVATSPAGEQKCVTLSYRK